MQLTYSENTWNRLVVRMHTSSFIPYKLDAISPANYGCALYLLSVAVSVAVSVAIHITQPQYTFKSGKRFHYSCTQNVHNNHITNKTELYNIDCGGFLGKSVFERACICARFARHFTRKSLYGIIFSVLVAFDDLLTSFLFACFAPFVRLAGLCEFST